MKNDRIKSKISIFIAVFIFLFSIFNSVPAVAQVSGIDLAPDALFWSPYSIKQGDNIFIGTRVKNLGTESAGPFRIMLTYNGFFLCSWDVSELNPNEIFERGPGLLGSSFSEKCVIYSAALSGYKIKAVVDDLGYIAETDKSNNATSTFLTVTPVNVEPSEPSVPGAYVPGYTPSPVIPPSAPNVPPVTSQNQQPLSPNIGNWGFLKGIVPCATSYAKNACTVCDFYVLIQNIMNFFLFVTAPLVTLGAVYVAFLFMFSGGSSSKITEAKDKLWLLIWGVFWIFGSWLVLNTILNFAVNKSVFPWPWNQINCTVSKPTIPISPPAGQPFETTLPAEALNEQEARNYFQQAGITINKDACPPGVAYQNVSGGCTSVYGVTALTLLDAVELKTDCQCALQITGGTEQGHAQGTLSHAGGNKLDFHSTSALDNYIQNNYTYIGFRNDGAKQYRASNGSIYAREGDHWDVTFAQ